MVQFHEFKNIKFNKVLQVNLLDSFFATAKKQRPVKFLNHTRKIKKAVYLTKIFFPLLIEDGYSKYVAHT